MDTFGNVFKNKSEKLVLENNSQLFESIFYILNYYLEHFFKIIIIIIKNILNKFE